jgi:hypothetical protein
LATQILLYRVPDVLKLLLYENHLVLCFESLLIMLSFFKHCLLNQLLNHFIFFRRNITKVMVIRSFSIWRCFRGDEFATAHILLHNRFKNISWTRWCIWHQHWVIYGHIKIKNVHLFLKSFINLRHEIILLLTLIQLKSFYVLSQIEKLL